jgi:hypothetical protein
MKIFEDLVFSQADSVTDDGTRKAVMMFDNGYGVSVLCGPGALSELDRPYELAVVIFQQNGGYKIIYPTLFNSDVISCLTSEEVTSYMKIIQALPELF